MKFLQLARKGKNNWWRYLITIILTNPGISLGAIIGSIYIYLLFELIALYPESPGFLGGLADLLSYNIISAFLIFILYFCMVSIHRRNFKTVLTAHEKIKWHRTLKGFMVWFLILLVLLFFSFSESNLKFTFDPVAYPFLVIVSLTIFFQAGFEEIFFRGYLLQALGMKKPILAVILTSLIFAIGHWGNQATFTGNIDIIIDTFIFGIVMAVITILEDGVETAIGIHTANNMFCALIVNDGTSAFYEALPSVFTDFSTPVTPLEQLVYSSLIMGALLLIIILPQRLNLIKNILKRWGCKSLNEKVVFKTNSRNLEVDDDIVSMKEKQKGTLSIKFRTPDKNKIEEIMEFFESLTDMEPLTMNIADTGEIKTYFRGTGPLDTIKEDDKTIYTFKATIQELQE